MFQLVVKLKSIIWPPVSEFSEVNAGVKREKDGNREKFNSDAFFSFHFLL